MAGCGRLGFEAITLEDDGPADGAIRDPGGDPDAAAVDAGGDPSLVGWWRFEDDPSDGVLDSSGRGHHGSCAVAGCPVLQAGASGPEYLFDGDGYIEVPHTPDLTPPQLTVAAWMRASVMHNGALISKPVGPGYDNSYQLEALGDGTASMTGQGYLQSPDPAYNVQTWVHLAGTYDGSLMQLFVNGVLVAEDTRALDVDGQDLVLGADINEGDLVGIVFRGGLWDLRLYERVLAPAEIEALAQMR